MWHWHFSEDREQTPSFGNKRALLSVLVGEPLADFIGGEMALTPQDLIAIWTHDLKDGDGVDPAYKVLNRAAVDAAAAKVASEGLAARPEPPPPVLDQAQVDAAVLAAMSNPDIIALYAKAVVDEEQRRLES
jgi:hypothetical protein